MDDGLGGASGAVATRPERRPRDQDRKGAARGRPTFPFGIGTKAANRHYLIASSVIFSHDPGFSISRCTTTQLWSVRVGAHYRALGLEKPEGIVWFWIGTHAEYDKLLS